MTKVGSWPASARTQAIGEHQRHVDVGERAIGLVVGGAELADVKQRRDIELRHQAAVDLIDVAKIDLVAEAALGVIELHRRHAEVCHDHVGVSVPLGGERLRQLVETQVVRREDIGANAVAPETRVGARQFDRVDVEADDALASAAAKAALATSARLICSGRSSPALPNWLMYGLGFGTTKSSAASYFGGAPA